MNVKMPKFTIRRLMIAVAIAGVGLGWHHWMHLRAAKFQSRANWHFLRWRTLCDPIPVQEATKPGWKFPPRVGYHFTMFMKYFNGADHPWLPIAPDPPEPK